MDYMLLGIIGEQPTHAYDLYRQLTGSEELKTLWTFRQSRLYAVLDKIENGQSILLDIEVQGAEQIKRQYPDAVTMFVVPPSWEELEKRLVNRGTDSMEKIQARLKQAKSEIEKIENYDYIIVNDVLETAISEVISIIATQDYKYDKRINDLTEAYSL